MVKPIKTIIVSLNSVKFLFPFENNFVSKKVLFCVSTILTNLEYLKKKIVCTVLVVRDIRKSRF